MRLLGTLAIVLTLASLKWAAARVGAPVELAATLYGYSACLVLVSRHPRAFFNNKEAA